MTSMSIRPITCSLFFYDFHTRSGDFYVNYFSKIKVTLMSIIKLQAVSFMSTIFLNKSDSHVDFKAAGSDFHVESREGDFQ